MERGRQYMDLLDVTDTVRSMAGYSNIKYGDGLGVEEFKETYTAFWGDEKRYESGGRLEGELKGAGFWAANVRTGAFMIGRAGRRSPGTIFWGCVFGFDGIETRGTVQIFSKKFPLEMRQWTESVKTATLDRNFDKNFDVYASDPSDVPLILTGTRLKGITDLYTAAGKGIAVTFRGGRLYAAVSGRELFVSSADGSPEERENIIRADMKMLEMAREILEK